MKSASKTVLMYCAFMRETSVRSRVLVGPSLFCEELKDKRDRINFVSVSKEKIFCMKKKKRKRATTKDFRVLQRYAFLSSCVVVL
jgi:hypothetical protein